MSAPLVRLLTTRRFVPLFATQFLGAFNDNLFKTAMVILVTYYVYSDPTKEAVFNAISGAVFILPFFLFSALAGQLADSSDKARIIRIVKTAEIVSEMKSRYLSDGAFKAAADSAIRAVHKSSPLKNLPADKYGSWKEFEINFDPKDLL